MVFKVLAVAENLKEKIDIEVIDLRTLVPIGIETIICSVKKTHKLVIAQEAARRGGVASDISSQIVEEIFDYLDYPVKLKRWLYGIISLFIKYYFLT